MAEYHGASEADNSLRPGPPEVVEIKSRQSYEVTRQRVRSRTVQNERGLSWVG